MPDPRMDIYSLGAVFYRMMTGYLPEPQTGVPYPIMDLDIPYSEGLKAAVSRATEFNPARRFKSAQQMKNALDNLEKLDPEYRNLGRLQILSGLLGSVCLAAGILMIYGGDRSLAEGSMAGSLFGTLYCVRSRRRILGYNRGDRHAQ